MHRLNSLQPQIEIRNDVVIGFIDGSRVIQLRVEDQDIVTDTSTCLPVRSPERYIELYMECLEKARRLLITKLTAQKS